MLGSLKFGCFAVLISKLGFIQIFNYTKYKKLSENNSQRLQFILPQRGNILDRNNKSFTTIKESQKLMFYKTSKDWKEIIKNAIDLLDKKPKDIEQFIQRIERIFKKNSKDPITLARNLTRKDIFQLEFNIQYLPGITILTNDTRFYLLANKAAHIIGSISRPNNKQIKETNPENRTLYQNYDFKIGQYGLEKVFDKELFGKPGIKITIIDAFRTKISESVLEKELNGNSIKTTLNYELQDYLGEIMKYYNGAASVIDVTNGNILAMYSGPTFDPNIISHGADDDEWDAILANQKNGLFLNKNISSVYPPGSTFKIISGLTALNKGIDPNKKFNCNGGYRIGNRIFHCWKEGGHGIVDFHSASTQSCDCYFYHLSKQIDINEIYETCVKLGLREKTNIELENEKKGNIPNRKWKREKDNQIWLPGDNANAVIGQGFVTTTPIQLLTMISRIATNKKITPNIIYDENNNNFEDLNLNIENLTLVKKSLFGVIEDEMGVLHRYKKANQITLAAGKTGSSQVISRRIKNEDMKAGKIREDHTVHGLFVGYAPFYNPKYAVSIVIEHGIAGSTTAAPIGMKLLEMVQKI